MLDKNTFQNNQVKKIEEIKRVKRTIEAPKLKSVTTVREVKFFGDIAPKKEVSQAVGNIHKRVAEGNRQNIPKKTFALLMRRGKGMRMSKKHPRFLTPVLPPVAPRSNEIVQRVLQGFLSPLVGFANNPHVVHFFRKRLVVATSALMLVSFIGGMVAVVAENKSQAEVLEESGVQIPKETITEADLEHFASTSIKLLQEGKQGYAGPDQLVARKAKLRKYLKDKNSPFFDDDQALDSLLSLPHRRLILAISYAESTMGRNCYFNNCSGIGGSVPNLRKYKEFRNWMIDLNDLLERRYKDWTLEQMCGVYVQPCNPNWLKATAQVLQELDNREIN